MGKKVAGFIAYMLVITIVLTSFTLDSFSIYAADSTVQIYIGESTTPRHHVSMAVGNTSEEYHYKLKGYEEKSSSFSSSDKKVFKIIDEKNGTCKIKAVGEGTGYLILTINTTDGKTITEKVFVSIYTAIDNYQGVVTTKSDVYRGAVTNANVENEDKKGEVLRGDEVTVLASCVDYYYVRMNDGRLFEDNFSVGFVKKNGITIPATGIVMVKENIYLQPNQTEKLDVKVAPELANCPEIIWSSENNQIATVDMNGRVKAIKTGETVIYAKTTDGKLVAQCKVNVDIIGYSSTNTLKKPNIRLGEVGGDWVMIYIESSKDFNGYDIYINGKRAGDSTIINSSSAAIKYIYGLKKGKTYKIKVKTFTGKDDKKKYSKFSNKIKFKCGKTMITTISNHKSITVKWHKINNIKYYKLYRSTQKHGKYKLIATVKKDKKKYIDKTVEMNKKYFYKVATVDVKNKSIYSNIDSGSTVKHTKVSKYLANKYSFICVDSKKKINDYNINGNYSPVKFKYSNGTLQIHLYLEFVTYSDANKAGNKEKIYTKTIAKVNSEISTSKYIEKFKNGIKNGYNIKVTGGNGDFKKGINFKTTLTIHEKKSGKKYKKEQKFIEVLIGGECPSCEGKSTKHWYHSHSGRIFMPTNEQVRANRDKNFNTPWGNLGKVATHELGHVLGLYEAYTDPETGEDRCADNNETGKRYDVYYFDNIMKKMVVVDKINSNGLEMILFSVDPKTGETSFLSQYFNYCEENKISEKIKNHYDYQNEENK